MLRMGVDHRECTVRYNDFDLFLKKLEKSGSKSEAKLNAKIHLLKDFFHYL